MNQRDWTLLNAYADGELEPAEMEMFSARLRQEPGLAAELHRILALKTGLAGLHATAGRSSGCAPASRRRAATIALAASLLIACLIGLSVSDRSTTADGGQTDIVLALHSEFSRISYPAAIAAGAPAGDIEPPDLSGSNLRIVDSRRGASPAAGAVGYHYRGPRGCRVTLVVGSSLQLPAQAALARRWTVGDRTLVLIADGMDPQRFAAIAAYAESATRNAHPGDDLRLALEERTAAARPCV